jgi:UDP-glucuronate 4-epimerase
LLDNFDPYYARARKAENLRAFEGNPDVEFVEADIRRASDLARFTEPFDFIVHLAAKAGVRPSIDDPVAYQESNVTGTQNMLELAKRLEVPQFVFASSSSVYGVNPRVPWREEDQDLMPISPYASTKISGELLGHVYSYLYGIRFIAVRPFTVYGPKQRPDLAIFKFAKLFREGKPIPVFGDGSTRRDYTFVEDIVDGLVRASRYKDSRYEIFNLGNSNTVVLNDLIEHLADAMGVDPKIERLPDQMGDVPQTWADASKAERLLGWKAKTPIQDGLRRFVAWYDATYPADRAVG